MQLIIGKAEIGILLMGLSILAIAVWVMPFEAFLSNKGLAPESLPISEFTFNAVISSPSIILTIAGLTQYFRGRRTLWKTSGRLNTILILVLVGVILILLGATFTLNTYASSVYYAGKPNRPGKTLDEYLVRNSPYFAWFALWVVTGTVLLLDLVLSEKQSTLT